MVTISSIAIENEADTIRVSAHVSMPGRSGEAWFLLPSNSQTDLDAASDCFFALGLILAMGSDGSLSMDRAVSHQLVYNSRSLQSILLAWHKSKLTKVELDVPIRDRDEPLVQDKTVACFTGGLDSFDTLLSNYDGIDGLLFVHGFDIGLAKTAVREATSAHLQTVSEQTGKELIEVATNIRKFLNLAGSWPVLTHGAALSAVGHLLSGKFGRLLIPSSHSYTDTYAWGSHPLTDHLWSSHRLTISHDGAGSNRVQKTINVAHNPIAQGHLRVCWQNTGKYNCSECDKCLRTMTALSLTGVLADFTTFKSELPLDEIQKLTISGRSGRSFVLENLLYAEQQGATELAAILRSSIADYDEKKRSKTKPSGYPGGEETSHQPALLNQSVASESTAQSSDASALEGRIRSLEKSVRVLQEYRPIRYWAKISAWLHRTKP